MLTPTEILGPGGRIAARLPRYEHRPEQLAMSEAIAEAIGRPGHLLAEAGTGIGKSFAYLTPAILAVTDPDRGDDQPPRRAVISTHTISLQEQLLLKDLPLLNSVIPREFATALVKGRGNYLSLRRMSNAAERSVSLFSAEEEFAQLRQIVAWSNKTNDGSLSDMKYRPLGQVWDEVNSDSGNCLGVKCPTYKECFYFQARRRMKNAQILLVNHALFFSDLALRRLGASILPDYDIAIFDEAHTLESVAGDHLGVRVGSGQVDYLLNKLYNDRTNRGLLVGQGLGFAEEAVMRCRVAADDLFNDLAEAREQGGPQNGRVNRAECVPNALSPALDSLAAMVKEHGQSLAEESKQQDFFSACDRLKSMAAEVELWRTQSLGNFVYWVESSTGRRGQRRMSLAAAPIDVGPTLREQLFDRVPTVIMTSATLSIGKSGSFDFIKSRIGLTGCETLRLGSPFDYPRQVELITLAGMPDPAAQKDEYQRVCLRMIRRYVERTDGRAFVLFTSYEAMRHAGSALSSWLAERNLRLFSQADGTPRTQMLDQFKSHPRAVLFGTDSFWQGVDVPGDALVNVIITKLPFSVPDHPLLEARLDAIRSVGGNPFRDYQLPEAVLKFRQGFGRLIRTCDDRGIVVILDPRITTKPYGKTFLESLPDCRRVVEHAEHDTPVDRSL